MKIVRSATLCLEEIWQKMCTHKWSSIICALVAAVGAICGVVFVNIFKYTWWYENRCAFAEKMFYGGFGLFFTFLLWTAVFYMAILCCSMTAKTRYLAYVPLFAACFYCGANTATAVILWSVWGILFAILVTVAEIVGYYLACLLVCCTPGCNRTIREAYCDTKMSLMVLLAAFCVKIICFFVILRLVTGII